MQYSNRHAASQRSYKDCQSCPVNESFHEINPPVLRSAALGYGLRPERSRVEDSMVQKLCVQRMVIMFALKLLPVTICWM